MYVYALLKMCVYADVADICAALTKTKYVRMCIYIYGNVRMCIYKTPMDPIFDAVDVCSAACYYAWYLETLFDRSLTDVGTCVQDILTTLWRPLDFIFLLTLLMKRLHLKIMVRLFSGYDRVCVCTHKCECTSIAATTCFCTL